MFNGILDIIFFAAVAIFILVRLRNVLGQKNDNDEDRSIQQKIHRQYGRKPKGEVVDFPGVAKDVTPIKKESKPIVVENKEVEEGLKAIAEQDKTFLLEDFMSGSNKAFEMILEAFSDENERVLKRMLSKDVFEDFAEDIATMRENNHKRDVILVSIQASDIVAASLNKNIANVTIKFISEQMQVVRDRETEEIVEGDASKIEKVEDIWVFTRNINSSNPNWKLSSIINDD